MSEKKIVTWRKPDRACPPRIECCAMLVGCTRQIQGEEGGVSRERDVCMSRQLGGECTWTASVISGYYRLMVLKIEEKLLKPRAAVYEKDWRVWEKKSLNIHRGVLDWPSIPYVDIDVIARRVREGVKREFKPGWFRGFGFGAILHLKAAPGDLTRICDHIDRRNKTAGVWQWAILQFKNENVALGVHTWLHGYLRPVYESVLDQLRSQGCECHSVEAEIDPLIKTLGRIAKICHLVGSIS
jgi:hypothetical protein